MRDPHFDFILTNTEGEPIAKPVRVNTATGVALQCHPAIKISKIRHLCDIARQTPGWPVDITHFEGEGMDSQLVWSARIYYRDRADA